MYVYAQNGHEDSARISHDETTSLMHVINFSFFEVQDVPTRASQNRREFVMKVHDRTVGLTTVNVVTS